MDRLGFKIKIAIDYIFYALRNTNSQRKVEESTIEIRKMPIGTNDAGFNSGGFVWVLEFERA